MNGALARGWARARETLGADLLSAVVVSVLLIPQSLAYALLAGLPPQTGLYASLLPLLAYAALGSSPVLGIGPVAVLALMISQAVSGAASLADPTSVALVLAAETGLLLAAAAALRLHALASLLSVPVLHGFETGAALSIMLSQLPVLLGASAGGSNLPEVLRSWWIAASPWQPVTAAFGLVSLAALWVARARAAGWLGRWLPRPQAAMVARLAPLAVIATATAIAVAIHADAHGVARVGNLPDLSVHLAWPPLQPALWWHLLPSALPIALVTFVSSLVVAESLARRQGGRVLPRRELTGLAAANLVSAVSAGMPVGGSFSRSVLHLDAGSRTRLAGAFTAVLMGMAILFVADALALLPKAVLAATIIAAVLAMLDLQPFRAAWRYDRAEGLLMAVVALLALLSSVTVALAVGVVASVALLLQRSAVPHVALVGRVPGTEHFRNIGRHEVHLTPGTMALRIDESLLFLNARPLTDVVQQLLDGYRRDHGEVRRVVLLMSPVNHIDLSGLEALRALHEMLQTLGLRLDLAEVKGPVADALHRSGWETWFRGRMFLSLHLAMLEPPVPSAPPAA
ncbi:MAG: STAS domain-containing protein [Ideonella sp.]|nr:STAS domain-containing protein [Ideonella sp.]